MKILSTKLLYHFSLFDVILGQTGLIGFWSQVATSFACSIIMIPPEEGIWTIGIIAITSRLIFTKCEKFCAIVFYLESFIINHSPSTVNISPLTWEIFLYLIFHLLNKLYSCFTILIQKFYQLRSQHFKAPNNWFLRRLVGHVHRVLKGKNIEYTLTIAFELGFSHLDVPVTHDLVFHTMDW